MEPAFEEIGRFGYMGHNGGYKFRQKTETDFEYQVNVQDVHLNSGGITHGGYIMTLLDSGMGSAVHRSLGGKRRIVTIALDVKFVAASQLGDTLVGSARIIRTTRTLVFARGELRVNDKVVATADGIWKIL